MNFAYANSPLSVGRRPAITGVLRYLAVAAVVMVLGSQAWAQAVVDRTRIVLDNWTFVPINSTSATGTRVHSFLALKNKADAVGGNIVSVWFLRPDQGGGEWDAKAWALARRDGRGRGR